MQGKHLNCYIISPSLCEYTDKLWLSRNQFIQVIKSVGMELFKIQKLIIILVDMGLTNMGFAFFGEEGWCGKQIKSHMQDKRSTANL